MNRRQAIFAAGGAGLALVLAGGSWRVFRTPERAFEPWAIAGLDREDVRRFAFAHAILAPNPHNRQPWVIRMDGADGALIFCDLDRRLPETDPYDRQITIGFGTFIELARIAAAQCGYKMVVEPFPEGEPEQRLDEKPIARLRFGKAGAEQPDPLFAHILKRRSTKTAYEQANPPTAAIAAEVAGEDAKVEQSAAALAGLRAIATAAVGIEMRTPRTHMESVRLMRIGADEIERNPDGIALSGPTIELAGLAGLVDREALADPGSTPYRQGLEQQLAICGSLPSALWIATEGNSRLAQLDAGRRYVRANLRATALGLAMHPVSQALQEYPEMAEQFAAVHRLLGVGEGRRVQMLARLGRAETVGPAPRWPLSHHIEG